MPFVLVVTDAEVIDPAKLLATLAESGHFDAVGDGWIVTPPDDDADPARVAHRRRQARYRARTRARKRDARDARVSDARDAGDAGNNGNSGGVIHSLSPLEGEERESETPKRDARDADARDAVTRDARDAHPSNGWDTGPPLTAAEREAQQARIRDLQAQLRATREGST